ncbi:hypothetical protein [Arenibaculum pallidiluteum]|uniref:hypothetical protein n=1 Tax=Arenibaculum pallidiluteum TaxID=2812559 RepID=UPI001A969A9A|nr:hypothetical protein [Arenibaculum pallidiluteum]
MPSTPTTRNRLEKQATGENLNVWGSNLNTKVIDLVDEALDGVETIAITSATTALTSTNYVPDQARNRVLVLSGTLAANSDVVIPGVEKWYLVVDSTVRAGFSLTMKVSGQAGYALRPGPQLVYCDGTDARRGGPRLDQLPLPASAVDLNGQRLTNLPAPAANADAATKSYVDNTAFSMAGGALPGQVGSAGHFLTTDGSTATWASVNAAIEPVSHTFTAAQRGKIAALADGATITPDFADANFFTVTLGGNRTLANPTNLAQGQSGSIIIRQDATGSRTLAYGSHWKFPGASAPVLTTAASRVDRLDYLVVSGTEIHAALTRDIR